MVAVIGPNGAGKSTLLDALGFIGDCMQLGVEEACEMEGRGGFESLRTKGEEGAISFELYYRQAARSRPISYTLKIELDASGRPVASEERLRQRRKGQSHGKPYDFLKLVSGSGHAWAGETTGSFERKGRESVELKDTGKLGIVTLGNLKEHPRIVAFREFLEGWYLSYFVPDLARRLPSAGSQKHLNRRGDNLANYLQHIHQRHQSRFENVLKSLAKKIPGIQSVGFEISRDRRLLLQFDESGYKDPFYQQSMSDGTLKMLAYLLLLADPEPAPLIGIEEPENGLYHQLLETLAKEMKNASTGGPQMILTTHSPYLADALTPAEVWVLQKNNRGHTSATRAADIEGVTELAAEGIPTGELWYSGHFGWRG